MSAPGWIRGPPFVLWLLIGLSHWLRVEARENADLAGRSLIPNFAGGILNSGEPPLLGLGGRGYEIQLDGQGVVIPDDQAPRDRGLVVWVSSKTGCPHRAIALSGVMPWRTL